MNNTENRSSATGVRAFVRFGAYVLATAAFACSTTVAAAEKVGRLVVVGDSLSAGFQNYSLLRTQQVNGYASLIARQAKVGLTLPEISYPGIPGVLEIQSYAPNGLPIVARAEGFGSRLNPTVQATNLAVPAAKVQDALDARPNGVVEGDLDGLVEVILGAPGLFQTPPVARTQIEWAEALDPDTLILWIGNNDVLLPAWLTGSDQGITDPMSFARSYTELLMRAVRTRASVVTANIPDITTVAAFVPDTQVEALLNLPAGTLQAFGVPQGSRFKVEALAALAATPPGVPPTLTPDMYLDPTEITNIRQAIRIYNNLIAAAGAVLGVPVVDVHQTVQKIVADGYTLRSGQTLTTNYLGGLYSLDGVHPTNTGYAVIANEFIRIMNSRMKTKLGLVDVDAVAAADPYVSH